MTTEYGLTAQGFVIKPTLTILEEMRDEYRASQGDVPVDDDTPDGVVLAIVAERAGECWELGEAVYNSQSRETATGRGLDNVCLLLGTFRPAASYSAVTLTLTGVPTTVVPATSRAGKDTTDEEFQTLSGATIAALSAWAGATAYAEGTRIHNGGHVYLCTTAGTSAGSGGPTGEGQAISDGAGALVWRWLGEGTGAVDTTARATVTGAVVASVNSIKEIVTPVSGWQGVANIDVASEGGLEATDEELRLLAEAEIQQAGNSPLPAIRAELRKIPGVTNVTVFHNTTYAVDADGVPPAHIEALVTGGDDADIFAVLFAAKAGGIGTHGTTSGTVTDDEGTEHTIKFSRPAEVPIYIIIDVVKDPDEYPTDGDTQVEEAIVTNETGDNIGRDAVSRRLGKHAFEVTGVLDTPVVRIGLAPGPTLETTLAITKRQVATYSTTRITVNASDGTP